MLEISTQIVIIQGLHTVFNPGFEKVDFLSKTTGFYKEYL